MGALLFIVIGLIFGAVLAASWLVMTLLLLPYYAITKVKPREEKSRGGYRIEDLKPADSETNKPRVVRKTIFCPYCGSAIDLPAKFCPKCGAELPPS
ncbi:zinc ribbon domain-containing protein [Candidatus Bathyarchaeota archaeon]|nr:MAG: zinc ribbon domain-containing protein [Candidatus Bathyarchaeota archaeon]